MAQVQNQIRTLGNKIKELDEKISEFKITKTAAESDNKGVTVSLLPDENSQNDCIHKKVTMERDLSSILAEEKQKIKEEILKEIRGVITEVTDKTNENTKNIARNIQKIETDIKIHEDAITKLELNNKIKKVMM